MEGGERTGACPWEGGDKPPPLEIGKKGAVRGNFNLFPYVLLMKLGGIDIHAKWKGVGGQALVHGGRGRGVEKKRGCQKKF